MKDLTFGWTTGQKCNITDPRTGQVIYYDHEVISDPFLFYGNKKEEIAIMVKGIRGAVPIDYVVEPVRQIEIEFKKPIKRRQLAA